MDRKNNRCFRNPPYKKIIAALLCIAICLALTASIIHADVILKKNILVLSSYHKGLSWTDSILKGIESQLETQDTNIELYIEYMDTKRYYDKKHFEKLYTLYKNKYSNTRFDIVIVSNNNAFDFARKYHKDLFPETPVVFCGINNFKDSMLDGLPLFTGVVENIDIKRTLEIALQLHPNATQIVVISDKTTSGIAINQEVKQISQLFEDRVDFVFFNDFDITELRTKVRELSSDSIILLTVVNRDKMGTFFTYEESLGIIYKETAVPIYSFWDAYLNRGIVGGNLTNGFQQGEYAGLIALRILEGESVAAIPVVKENLNEYMFDLTQMRRFGIKQSDLPVDSVIINQPQTFYSKNRKFILVTAPIVLILTIIIGALLWNITKRKKMEKALRESEARYRDLYENAPDMYHSLNKDGVIIYCNDTEARMLGYTKEEIIGRPITDFFTETSKKLYEKEFPTLKDKKVHLGLEREFIRKDGSVLTASLNIFTEVDDSGELSLTRTIARDITERKRLDELKKSKERLQCYSEYLDNVREEEKKRIAREIHDQLGHALTTLSLDLSWISKRLPDEIRTLVERTQAMSSLIDTTIESVQRISSELVPGVLDHLGLIEAIKWQTDEYRKRTNMEFELFFASETLDLDFDKSLVIFRIYQEALTNIIRHAKATKVDISLTEEDCILVLNVKDNGVGIRDEQIYDPGSIGIMGIRERVRILEGMVTFSSENSKGTEVNVTIPHRRNA